MCRICRLFGNAQGVAHAVAIAWCLNGPNGVPPIRRGYPQLDPTSSARLRTWSTSAATNYSVTQPIPDRRHARSDQNSAEHDKRAPQCDDPHRLGTNCPGRKNDGKNNNSDDEAVGVHVPREPATMHAHNPTAEPATRRLNLPPFCRRVTPLTRSHL